jgi:hypothetical protein
MTHLPNGVALRLQYRDTRNAADVLAWCISTYHLGEHENLRLYGLRSDGQPAVELQDDELVQPYASTSLRIAPAGQGDVVVPEPASWRHLCEKLPRVGFSSRYRLWRDLEQLPEGAIDRSSIREVPNRILETDEAKKVQQQVRVVDFTSMTFNRIRRFGPDFVPTEATDKEVTLRTVQFVSYMSVPEALYPELKRLQAALRPSQKLLHDLPIALENSKAAQLKAVEAEDRDLNELGAMTYEQHRISKEVTEQQAKATVIQQKVHAILAAPKQRMSDDSSISLAWMDHYEIEGAAVTAFQSAEHYARSCAGTPARLLG